MAKRKKAKKKKINTGLWTKQEIKMLRALFPKTRTREVAATIGRPPEATKKKAHKLGLKKSKRYLKSIGRA